MNTYLTTRQLAERLGYSPRTIRGAMKDVVFLEGVHYFRPFRKGNPLYIWEVIEREMRAHSEEHGLHNVLMDKKEG